MSLVGNLEELGLGEILQIVSLSRKTGVLSLHSNGRDGSIVFRQGQVVRASSSTFQQSLGEVLVQNGVIDLAVLRKALAFQQEEGFRDRLGSILIKHFGISYDVVEEVVREQIENVVYTLFSWQEGSFEFVTSENADSSDGTRLDPLQFMLNQGLNPQLLAMEGSRLLDENVHAAELGYNSTSPGRRGGTELEFDLADAPRIKPSKKSRQPAPKMPLVIVDDDGPTLKAIADGMREQGYDVHAMTRSEDTLIKVDAICRGGENPTILIDLIMPKMDGSGVLGGLELLELIHNNFKDIHIIMMTDYHHADAESKVQDLGYTFIMKPRRSDISDEVIFQDFIGLLFDEVGRVEAGEEPPDRQENFNLGDEMRIEMGDAALSQPPQDRESSNMSLLRGMLEELNNPDLQGGVLLLVLRFASEFLNRAIVFSVHDRIVSGVGQFGISEGKTSGDEKVRAIHFPLDADSMFKSPARTFQPVTFTPDPSAQDVHVFEQLGGGIPEEAYIGPLVSQSRVIGFLYGDNLPEKKPVGDTECLSIFLAQAGVVMEKSNLEKQLHEKVKP
jgi:CheY-like chemotaxis protein